MLAAVTMSSGKKIKVLITNPTVPKVGIELLQEKGCEVLITNDISKKAILEKVAGVDALFLAGHTKLDTEILDAAGPQMKTIGTMSAGYDHIDLQELKKRNIKLGNTPNVLNDAVADIAVLLTIAASRRFREGRLAIENGKWITTDQQWLLGRDLAGSTVGILGFGRIGQTFARRIKAFNVKNIYYTHREVPAGKEIGAQFVSFDKLIAESDFIVSILPATNKTVNMFNDDLFGKMKNTTVFVNVGRGAVVDQDALLTALKNGKIFSAGLDVMTPEPLPTDSELLKLPNLVITPHIGSATVGTRDAMAKLTVENIMAGINGTEMPAPVKF